MMTTMSTVICRLTMMSQKVDKTLCALKAFLNKYLLGKAYSHTVCLQTVCYLSTVSIQTSQYFLIFNQMAFLIKVITIIDRRIVLLKTHYELHGQ